MTPFEAMGLLSEAEAITPETIKSKRLGLGVTQNQLAEKLDVTPYMVSHWETGRRDINKIQAIAITAGLDSCLKMKK